MQQNQSESQISMGELLRKVQNRHISGKQCFEYHYILDNKPVHLNLSFKMVILMRQPWKANVLLQERHWLPWWTSACNLGQLLMVISLAHPVHIVITFEADPTSLLMNAINVWFRTSHVKTTNEMVMACRTLCVILQRHVYSHMHAYSSRSPEGDCPVFTSLIR